MEKKQDGLVIFTIVSLTCLSIVCLSIVILFGSYLCKEYRSKESVISIAGTDKQVSDLNSEEEAAQVTQSNHADTQSANSVLTTENLTDTETPDNAKSQASNPDSAAPDDVPSLPSYSASPASVKHNYVITLKVNDDIKLGDVEIKVNNSTDAYKEIVITLQRNTSEQKFRENTQIILEILEDVIVNIKQKPAN